MSAVYNKSINDYMLNNQNTQNSQNMPTYTLKNTLKNISENTQNSQNTPNYTPNYTLDYTPNYTPYNKSTLMQNAAYIKFLEIVEHRHIKINKYCTPTAPNSPCSDND